MQQQRDSQAGVGLIEIVIAVVLIGTAIAALSATLLTGIRASTSHRELTTIDTVLRSHAEAIKEAVRRDCAVASPTTWTIVYPTDPAVPSARPPDGYSVDPPGGACPSGDPLSSGCPVDSLPSGGGGELRGTCLALDAFGPNATKSLTIMVRQP